MRTFLEYVFAQYSPQLQSFVDHIYKEILSAGQNSEIDSYTVHNLKNNLEPEFYDFLTASAHGKENKKYSVSPWDNNNPEYSKKQQDFYLKTTASLKTPWQRSAYPPWLSFKRSDVQTDEKQYNLKRYITLQDNNDHKIGEIQKLDRLIVELDRVKSAYSLKVPLFIQWLHEGIDNVVIYYDDPNDKQKIDQAILNSDIKEADRSQYYRANHGVDKRQGSLMRSDTEWTAKYMSEKFVKAIDITSIKDMPQIQAKNLIADTLNTILRLESSHRTDYDKDPYYS
jgi:hypothetical protein